MFIFIVKYDAEGVVLRLHLKRLHYYTVFVYNYHCLEPNVCTLISPLNKKASRSDPANYRPVNLHLMQALGAHCKQAHTESPG